MKSKRGFTLVELIAVIAILAVILLLIVPNIVQMFENGKKDAFIRQVQSVWKEAENEFAVDFANDIDTRIFSDSTSNVGKTLKLGKTKITYVAIFDEDGDIDYIAVGDKNYCYIKSNPSDKEITRLDVSEGTLSCSDQGCTCAGKSESTNNSGGGNTPTLNESKYAYWDFYTPADSDNHPPKAPNSIYINSYYPSAATNTMLGIRSQIFMKTELNSDKSVKEHNICISLSNDLSNNSCINLSMFGEDWNENVSTLENYVGSFSLDETPACKVMEGERVMCTLFSGMNSIMRCEYSAEYGERGLACDLFGAYHDSSTNESYKIQCVTYGDINSSSGVGCYVPELFKLDATVPIVPGPMLPVAN